MATANVSKRDVEVFCNMCVLARSTYCHFQLLFGATQRRRDLLWQIAPIFFGDLNLMMIEHMTLQICRLTDPEETRGDKNLTVKFLIKNSDFSDAPAESDTLNQLSQKLHAFRDKVAPARNKRVSHVDRVAALSKTSLGAAPVAEWDEFWINLQAFLEIMHRRYVDRAGTLRLIDIGGISDADSLVKAVKESTYFETLLKDHEMSPRAADVAFASKYFDA